MSNNRKRDSLFNQIGKSIVTQDTQGKNLSTQSLERKKPSASNRHKTFKPPITETTAAKKQEDSLDTLLSSALDKARPTSIVGPSGKTSHGIRLTPISKRK